MIPRHHRRDAGATAYTLIELLVVCGVIALLIGLLLPSINNVRQQAQATDTANTLRTLAEAIERYHIDYRVWPGPLADSTIYTGAGTPANVGGAGRVTMSENLVLALCGGIVAGAYDPTAVGKGMPGAISYLDVPTAAGISSRTTRFTDSAGRTANDTNVPEFIDRFGEPLPYLYLRARVGADGVVSAVDPPAQYDLRQLLPYTGTNIGGKTHGLNAIGPNTPFNERIVNQALSYLQDIYRPGVPRQWNGYLLISAGRDRIYGTADDINNVGPMVRQ